MTKKHLLLGAAVAALSLGSMSVPAAAQTSRIYLAGYLGLNLFNDLEFTDSNAGNSGDFEVDNAPSFAGALGIRLSHQWRFEGELSYRNGEFATADVAGVGTINTGGELTSTILFANMYYDFDIPWTLQPYVGGGVGYGWHSGEVIAGGLPNASSDDSSILWNAAAGVKYRANPDFAVTAGYRYIDSLDFDIGAYEVDYDSHEFRIGMEWDLPTR